MSKLSNQRRIRLLTTASVAVAMAGVAQAAETTITPDGTTPLNPLDTSAVVPSASTGDIIAAVLENVGDITAEVSNTEGGVDSEIGAGDNLTVDVNANDVLAVAVGNNFDSSIDLAAITNVGGDGAAALGFAINSPSGDDLTGEFLTDLQTADITAIASFNSIGVDFDDIDVDDGSISASDNTIQASATANAGATEIAGDLPGTYTSGTTGFATSEFSDDAEADWLDATGSLVASTLQINVLGDHDTDDLGEEDDDTPDVHARVDGNTIGIELIGADLTDFDDTDPQNPISGIDELVTEVTAVVEGNEIAANAKGNSATSLIDVNDAAAFEGSAVVVNAQINLANPGLPGATAEIRAENNDSTISVDIDSDDSSEDINTLDGTVALTGNTISSLASGNESLGTGGAAGNSILLDDGMSFEGPTDQTEAPGSEMTYLLGGNENTVAADLVIYNSQGNVGASEENPLLISSTTDDGRVEAYVQAVTTDGTSVSLVQNTLSSTARGNAASSAFATGDGSALFDGSVALASQQSNFQTDIEAANVEGDILAFVADEDQEFLAAGTVLLDSNAITAQATGSQSSQSLTLDAVDVDLTDDSEAVSLFGGVDDIGDLDVAGAATVANLQGLFESRVGAFVGEASTVIETEADNVAASTLTSTENSTTANAVGNAASSTFALSGTTLDGGIGAASVQIVDDSLVGSSNIFTEIGIEAEETDIENSTLALTGNDQSAVAYGNQVSQTGSVEGTTLDFADTGVALGGDDFGVGATGNVAVANNQSVEDSSVGSTLGDAWIYIDAEDISGSTLQIVPSDTSANVQQAVAVGSSGSNGLSVKGVDAGTGAGVVSGQSLMGESSVTAGNYDSGIEIDVNEVGFDGDEGSTIEASGNVQRAVAYGNTVSNALSIDAETLVVDEDIDGDASVVPSDPTVTAAYGVLNIQNVSDSNVGAEIIGYGVSIETDNVVGSTLLNESNAYVAAAYGNDATNAASLTHGNVSSEADLDDEPDFTSVLNLTNTQVVSEGFVFAQAAAADEGGTVYEIDINGDVAGSSVSNSENTVQALAYGNLANNDVVVDVNNVNTEADSLFTGNAEVEADVASVDASFSLNNVQFAEGQFVATLLNDGDPGVSAGIVTIVDDVIDSTVVANGNQLIASSTANRADNLISVEGNALATSTSLTNYQVDPSNVIANIGTAGGEDEVLIPGTPNTTFEYDYTTYYYVNTQQCEGTCPVTDAFDVIDLETAGLTEDQYNYLTDNGWVYNDGDYTLVRDIPDMDPVAQGDVLAGIAGVPGSDSAELNDGTPDTYEYIYVPGSGGVTIAIGGMVDPSTVQVNDNSVSGSVTGNSATNAIEVSATTLPDGTDHILTTAGSEGTDTFTLADHNLVNVQLVTEGSNLASTVYGTFGIDMDDEELVLDSTMEVDGNSQSSRAVANTADNSVTLEAGNTEAGAALASNQASDATVSALSGVDIFTPVASSNSTVSMSDNSNLAVAVINNVTNTVTVEATNADPVTFLGNANLDVDAPGYDEFAQGDHILLNKQTATTSATATASTNIFNDDYLDTDSEGLAGGSVLVTGNSTVAEASANRAFNTMDVSASSTLNASAGLLNSQASSASVLSTATTVAGATIVTDDLASVDGATVTLGQNTTSSLARGNAATNVLNYSAGASYGEGSGFSPGAFIDSAGDVDAAVSARAAVLNVQNNTGDVSAVTTQTSYLVALNSGGNAVMLNSTVGVIGNAVSATAYGNTATNVLTVSTLSASAPTAAIGNYQTNTANVTASATTVAYGVTSGLGAISGSTASVTSNAITATAVGNNAVNSIVGK